MLSHPNRGDLTLWSRVAVGKALLGWGSERLTPWHKPTRRFDAHVKRGALEPSPRRCQNRLYCLNRLNVATSRAQCLAVVVASPQVLRVRCRRPREMRFANALARIAEVANEQERRGREGILRSMRRVIRPSKSDEMAGLQDQAEAHSKALESSSLVRLRRLEPGVLSSFAAFNPLQANRP